MNSKELTQGLLASADIKIGGNRPWDVKVINNRAYDRIIHNSWLGLGESYMDGDWECPALDIAITKVLGADFENKLKSDHQLIIKIGFQIIKERLINKGGRSKAFEVAEKHYDLGNDLFRYMLDKRMVYTCGYWGKATNLDAAQEAKLELVCKKLGLQPGMRVLDIGGGWGSFAKYAAENYGVSVVNITISKEQVNLADELCKGLPVENRLQDYRDVRERFDRIVSLGMFEHVGAKFYQKYMKVVRENLADDGLFLLHTIGRDVTSPTLNSWIEKYIFPNGHLPSLKEITTASEGLFVMEDWHNFGADYDKTLMAWYKNFEDNWDKIKDNYDERFHRMWRLYLLTCAGGFRTRKQQLWQIVFSKNGLKGGYTSIR